MIKKIDAVKRQILLTDGTVLSLDDIVSVEDSVFSVAIHEKGEVRDTPAYKEAYKMGRGV